MRSLLVVLACWVLAPGIAGAEDPVPATTPEATPPVPPPAEATPAIAPVAAPAIAPVAAPPPAAPVAAPPQTAPPQAAPPPAATSQVAVVAVQPQRARTYPKLGRRSVSVGLGMLSTTGASGREDTTAYGISADWRPLADRMWGLRGQYAYGSISDGTSLVHSSRTSHLVSVVATRHWRATGALHLFGGLGLGMAAVYTSHNVGNDTSTGLAFKPAWSSTAGLEIPFERFVLRMDATGFWHQISYDRLYAVRVGARF